LPCTYSLYPGKLLYALENLGISAPELLFIVSRRRFILDEQPSGRLDFLCTHKARTRLDINRAGSRHIEAALLSQLALRIDVQLLVYGRL
jgi:hypothetical protein